MSLADASPRRGPARRELRPDHLRALVGVPLSEEQLTAATAPLEPGVIVAGAGTGKTTVMSARVVWLVATGAVATDAVLGLTFTTKAAAGLLGKVREALATAAAAGLWTPGTGPGDAGADTDAGDGDPTIGTYHAFASRLLSEHGLRIGVEPGSVLLSEPARYQLAHRVVCRSALPLADLDASPVRLVRWVLALDDALAEHAVEPDALVAADDSLLAVLDALPSLQSIGVTMRATAVRRRLLAHLVTALRAEKRARDVIDFADQVRLAARLAESSADVVATLRARHAVVLLDEYQDTSVAQRRLLQALFGGGHPVTAVGDPCQAIYGWRGASVHNIDAFVDHFPRTAPGDARAPARRYTLTENRRSGARILAAANDLAAPLREEHPGVAPLVPAGARGAGRLETGLFETQAEELSWLASRVAAMRPELGSWREVAVLARVGADLGPLADSLVAAGVPVEVVGTQGLLSRPEVIDVVSVLRVLHDPSRNVAMLRLLTGPRWRVGPRDLAALGRRAAELAGGQGQRRTGLDAALDGAVAGTDPVELVALADAVDDPGGAALSEAARERLARLALELRGLRGWVGEPLVDLVHRVLQVTGLDVELAGGPGPVAAARRAAVESFVDLAATFRDVEGGAGLGAFLAWLDDAERFDVSPDAVSPSGRDAVTLMTCHRSKGLEFPVVVLPHLSATVFPSGRGHGRWPTSPEVLPLAVRDEPVTPALAGFPGPDGPRARDHAAFAAECRRLELLEETRLGYVAATRAERLLVATGAWWGPEQARRRGPSPFLRVLAEHCRDGSGEVVRWSEEPAADAVNPVLGAGRPIVAWPPTGDPEPAAVRAAAAAAVRSARTSLAGLDPDVAWRSVRADVDHLDGDDRDLVAVWDADLAALRDEARATEQGAARRVVPVPGSLSASSLLALAADPDGYARRLVRPMPRPPAEGARRGTAFHAWLESRSGQLLLLDPDDVPGAADSTLGEDRELAELRDAFLAGEWADRIPHAVEEPFVLVLGGRVVRGRIDAVFRHETGAGVRWEVVDWKTGRRADADPLQLAVYRLAWAERVGVPVDQVDATVAYLRLGRSDALTGLPARAELEALLRDDRPPGETESP